MDESTKHSTVFDSDQQQLGKVYASALLAFGKDAGKLDQMVEELDGIIDVVGKVPGMQDALESPRIDFDDKAKMLDKAFHGKVDKGVIDFLKVVGRKGRFDCLGAISASARDMQDELSGRVKAVLTSASEIDDSVRDNISDKLSKILGKTVNLTSVVDPEILGGIVVRVGDTVYDGSVVNQLAQVRVKAVKKAADAIRAQLDRFASSS